MSDGFIKHDDGKPDFSLVPPVALTEVARVLTHALKKYPRDNWKKNKEPHRYVAAILRHVFAYMRGEKMDPESGMHHMACAVCSAMFLVELDAREIPACGHEWREANPLKVGTSCGRSTIEGGERTWHHHRCETQDCLGVSHRCGCGATHRVE